jgi:hypothetical protein
MSIAVLASGESIRFLPDIIDEFDEAYFVNGNLEPLLLQNSKKLKTKRLYQIANRMLPSIMDRETYQTLGVDEVFFTVPKHRMGEILSSIALVESYGLCWHFTPDDLTWVFTNHNNISFYGMVRSILFHYHETVYIIGFDFWTGDYTFKKSTEEQKAIPKNKKLYESFYHLVNLYSNTKFKMYTVANIEPKENLEVIRVPKIGAGVEE